MSAPDTDIIMTLSISGRRFQVLIMQDAVRTWFGTISERTDSQGHTRPLGSVETQDGPEVALQGALDHILRAVGFRLRATRVTTPVRADPWSPGNVSGARVDEAHVDQALVGAERQQPSKTLRQLREEQGWTQPDLAGFLGLSQGLISRWERGAAIPPEPQQYRLARLFGVSVTAIAFGHDVGHTETIDNEREAHAEVGMEDA